jgi:hypothetical protein
MFENRMLKKYLHLRDRKKQEAGENDIMRNFIIFMPHHMLLG